MQRIKRLREIHFLCLQKEIQLVPENGNYERKEREKSLSEKLEIMGLPEKTVI
jgi:hypothetical protein